MIIKQDSHNQIENDEPPGVEYSKKSGSEGKKNKASTLQKFMPLILSNYEITESINSLNLKQSKVFNVVYSWVKGKVKYDEDHVEPNHIFFKQYMHTCISFGESDIQRYIKNVDLSL